MRIASYQFERMHAGELILLSGGQHAQEIQAPQIR
jgi:hypothetical protein